MNPESHIDPQVEELLQALTTHAKNVRRQADILQKVEHLAAPETSSKRRTGWIYWAGLAAAACVAAVLLVRPEEPASVADVPVAENQIMVASIQEPPQEIPQEPLQEAPLRQKRIRKTVPVRSAVEQSLPVETPRIETCPTDVAEPQESLTLSENLEMAEVVEETAPQRIVIESQNLVSYKKRASRSRRNGNGPKKDLFGNPIRPDDGVLFAMQL